jgi:glycine cleavage system H protein
MKYTDSHEWIKIEKGNLAKVGISSHAQKELGEIVYVQLPAIGEEVKKGAEIAVLESTKAAADIYCPVSGKVTKVNEILKNGCACLNEDPEHSGYLFEMEIEDLKELDSLLDKTAYHTLIESSK